MTDRSEFKVVYSVCFGPPRLCCLTYRTGTRLLLPMVLILQMHYAVYDQFELQQACTAWAVYLMPISFYKFWWFSSFFSGFCRFLAPWCKNDFPLLIQQSWVHRFLPLRSKEPSIFQDLLCFFHGKTLLHLLWCVDQALDGGWLATGKACSKLLPFLVIQLSSLQF